MKTIINILSVIIASSLVFVSCSKDDRILDSSAPVFLFIYFHNKVNEDKLSIDDLDITIQYTNPKGKTTIATNDELDNGAFNKSFKKIIYPHKEGIRFPLSFFPVNYPDDINTHNVMGAIMKFKLILRKKGDEKIIFENTFICTFDNDKGNPFVGVQSVEIEKPDLENIRKDHFGFHIYI